MWIVGGVVVVLVLAALAAWWWSLHARGRQAPEERPPPSGLPPDRDATWDPHERYDHGRDQPPAADPRRNA